MAEEESTQKMENIILELNKSGLAYLVSCNSCLSQASSARLSSTSRKQNEQLHNS
jgi:hypothetical protein